MRKGGNRSGKHLNPRRHLRATPEEFEMMDVARGTMSWQDWAQWRLLRDAKAAIRRNDSNTDSEPYLKKRR
jgi:hypothetical protein